MATPLNIKYRGFTLYKNNPTKSNGGNIPNQLCVDVTDGIATWRDVTHVAYQGGYNPIYGFSLEDTIEKINRLFKNMGKNEQRRLREMRATLADHQAKLTEVNQQINALEYEARWLSEEIRYYVKELNPE